MQAESLLDGEQATRKRPDFVQRGSTNTACYGGTVGPTNWMEGFPDGDVQTKFIRPMFINARRPHNYHRPPARIFMGYPGGGLNRLQAAETPVRRLYRTSRPRYHISSTYVQSPTSENYTSCPDLKTKYLHLQEFRPPSPWFSPYRNAFLSNVPFPESIIPRGRGSPCQTASRSWFGDPWSDFYGDNHVSPNLYRPAQYNRLHPSERSHRNPFSHVKECFPRKTAMPDELWQEHEENLDKRPEPELPKPSRATGPDLAEEISASLISTSLGHSAFFGDTNFDISLQQVKKELEQVVFDELEIITRREREAILSTYPTEEEWLELGIPTPRVVFVPCDFWPCFQW